MLDAFHLPPNKGIIQLDVVAGDSLTTTTGNNRAVLKPRGAKWLYAFCVGAGGGGGGGNSTGGSGGGSGAQSVICVPAFMLPDILYVRASSGGAGGAAAGNGSAAIASYILLYPTLSATPPTNDTLLAIGGGGGGLTGAGTVGAAGAISSLANGNLSSYCMTSFLIGQAGALGGAAASNGASVTYPVTGLFVTGGAGGGASGVTVGGNITASLSNSSLFPTVVGGTSGDPGMNGNSGTHSIFTNNRPMFFATGGAGGGPSTGVGAAGRGGNAGYGSGGGGGGGGGFTNGAGGKGGPALFILAWL